MSQVNEITKTNKKLKQGNIKLSNFMKNIGDNLITEKTLKRISNCADYMSFLQGMEISKDGEIGESKKVVVKGSFCNHRFCPVCGKNKARKDTLRLMTLSNWITNGLGKRLLFLTLTVPNCKDYELRDTITKMNIAFNRYMKYKIFEDIILGHVKKIEVTYNSDKENKSYNTYHPHFHVLIAVEPDYFRHGYIKHSVWLEKWQKVMKDSSITEVHVQTVKNTDKFCLELGKYIAKDSDYLISQEVFKTFYTSLKGCRMLTYSGLFKIGIKKYEKDGLKEFTEDRKDIIVSNYVDSTWIKKDYVNTIINAKNIDRDTFIMIDTILQKRRYRLRMERGNLFVRYIGKTTYGTDNDILQDGI